MRYWIIASNLVVLIAPLHAGNDEAELAKLQGTWRLVRELEDGKEMPAEQAKKIRLIFDREGKWRVEDGGKVVGQGTAKIDPTKKPKTIDYTFGGEAKGTKFIAIYELDGDTFKHCGVLKGDRPARFESPPGSGHTLTIFQREKKK